MFNCLRKKIKEDQKIVPIVPKNTNRIYAKCKKEINAQCKTKIGPTIDLSILIKKKNSELKKSSSIQDHMENQDSPQNQDSTAEFISQENLFENQGSVLFLIDCPENLSVASNDSLEYYPYSQFVQN